MGARSFFVQKAMDFEWLRFKERKFGSQKISLLKAIFGKFNLWVWITLWVTFKVLDNQIDFVC